MGKRLLFIVHSFSFGGGAEKVLSSLITQICKSREFDISLLEIHHEGVAWEPLPDCVHVLHPVVDETKSGIFSRIRRGVMRRILDHCPFLARFVVRGFRRYDLVVAFNYLVPTYLVWRGEPSIAWNHGSIENLADRRRDRERLRRSLSHFNRIVAIARRTYDSILEIYPEYKDKTRIVYNGFPFDEIEARSNEPIAVELRQPALVAVGRLDENKDPLRILRVFGILHERHPECHLYFLGDGELREELQEALKVEGLHECVHLLGYRRNPYPYIKQASCLISMSRAEGFQTVFIESLALGVPFISTPVGAAEELSGDGRFGFVLEVDSEIVEAFARIVELNAKPGETLRRSRFVKRFSLESQAEVFCDLVSEVLMEEGRL